MPTRGVRGTQSCTPEVSPHPTASLWFQQHPAAPSIEMFSTAVSCLSFNPHRISHAPEHPSYMGPVSQQFADSHCPVCNYGCISSLLACFLSIFEKSAILGCQHVISATQWVLMNIHRANRF
jgi:hypothetical protein